MTENEEGRAGQTLDADMGNDPIGAFLSFIDLMISKAQGRIMLEYPKALIHLAPLLVIRCRTASQLFRVYNIMAHDIRDKLVDSIAQLPRDDADRREFEKLEGELKACYPARMTMEVGRPGVNVANRPVYSFYGQASESGSTEEKGKEPRKSTRFKRIEGSDDDEEDEEHRVKGLRPKKTQADAIVLPENVEVGRSITEENIFTDNNCRMSQIMTDFRKLAFKLGIVSVNDAIIVDVGETTSEAFRERIEKRRYGPAPDEGS